LSGEVTINLPVILAPRVARDIFATAVPNPAAVPLAFRSGIPVSQTVCDV